MKDLKFSANSWVFGPITIQELAKRAKEIGLNGLEIDGEPDKMDILQVKKALEENGLETISICGTFNKEDRAFNHSNPKCRQAAVEYSKKLIDMAVALGSSKVLLVPSMTFRLDYFESKEKDWGNAVNAIRETAEYALSKNVVLMFECVNRYEVNLVYSLEDGIRMAKEIGTGNVKLVGDTFHMQLEEASGIHNAIRKAGNDWLAHLHLGDNNREVPGKGSMDWKEIFMALRDIDFEGAVSFEPLPRRLTPAQINEGALNPDELQAEMTTSIKFLKMMMAGL